MHYFLSYMLVALLAFPLIGKAQKSTTEGFDTVYQTDRLIVTKLSQSVYVHTSFLQTDTWGKVPCNGMVVNHVHEAVVFDTPTNDSSSAELIAWINNGLQSRIKGVIPTHFHKDCLGGLTLFHRENIASYATQHTIQLAVEHGFDLPLKAFKQTLILEVGNKKVEARFLGEGHTKDNIVGYFAGDRILFGGCLIKELNADKGFVDDANVTAWPKTVQQVKKQYPNVRLVIPGHGSVGNASLLDYTISLFTTP